jgi:hypothetical protein
MWETGILYIVQSSFLTQINVLPSFVMPPKDLFHDAVKRALEKDGWTITQEQLPVSFELGDMYIDLGAEKILAAQKDSEKIAVEIKSFVRASAISEFHTALGQFINYRFARFRTRTRTYTIFSSPS